ncbi:hypothetical protein D6774_02850 [Candidatus Woesearchaeota archaeon]|nr:MAG: hypothetical protein D6774_02850 [Candidatus Woesearchaeota archaeon]
MHLSVLTSLLIFAKCYVHSNKVVFFLTKIYKRRAKPKRSLVTKKELVGTALVTELIALRTDTA